MDLAVSQAERSLTRERLHLFVIEVKYSKFNDDFNCSKLQQQGNLMQPTVK